MKICKNCQGTVIDFDTTLSTTTKICQCEKLQEEKYRAVVQVLREREETAILERTTKAFDLLRECQEAIHSEFCG